jgi:putative PIN family toxin of toxin-antitoxin system
MTVVIDTNVLVSAVLIKESISDRVVRKAFSNDVVIRSAATTVELSNTLKKQKFDKYFRNEYERNLFIHLFTTRSQIIEVSHAVTVCRDPKDNKYLELALSGSAECIITGDQDLLVLSPFENIPIITPREFLIRF